MTEPVVPPPSATRTASSANAGRLWRLCQKELREILRDRRTIVTLVLMPILVYPILSLVFQRFLVNKATNQRAEAVFRIGIDSEENATILHTYLEHGAERLMRQSIKADQEAGRKVVDPQQVIDDKLKLDADTTTSQVYSASETVVRGLRDIEWLVVEDSDLMLTSPLDLTISIKKIGEAQLPDKNSNQASQDSRVVIPPAVFELTYQENSANSRAALDFIERRLQAVNNAFARHQFRKMGIPLATPATVIQRGVVKKVPPSISLSSLIPLILIMMTITGAVYPAIDLTAGERERGTLEALIAAPVSRIHILLAKYVAVVTVALLTAAANLISMALTLYSSGLGKALFGKNLMTLQTLFLVFLLLVLFAMFFSAVLLAITSFARSFKEAQAYLIPLMLISLAPGLVCLIPEVKFAGAVAVMAVDKYCSTGS